MVLGMVVVLRDAQYLWGRRERYTAKQMAAYRSRLRERADARVAVILSSNIISKEDALLEGQLLEQVSVILTKLMAYCDPPDHRATPVG